MKEDVPQVDIPLLRKHVEWVEEEAAKPWIERVWNQNYWIIPADQAEPAPAELTRGDAKFGQVKNFCGTCYCLAGNVAAQDGYSVFHNGMAKNPVTGQTVNPEQYAMGRLRLTYEQAYRLFDEDNSAQDIRRIAEEIAGERL